MTTAVREFMTPNPTTVSGDTAIAEAARTMRDQDIGAVLVDTPRGTAIVTDRDIVVRGLAAGLPPTTPVQTICSQVLMIVDHEDSFEDAVRAMREHAVRRLIVCAGGEPVGILSLGDLAVGSDPESLLGGISRAVPNR